jgi:hypothetical protein
MEFFSLKSGLWNSFRLKNGLWNSFTLIYIDDFDQEATTDLINIKKIWEFLKTKYKKIRLLVGNQYLTQLINY